MALKYTRKKSQKRTYAERVMNAISDVRKRHRRGGIHVSSVKAQVRKNAEADDDSLGPNWQTWVGSTIKGLQSKGILTSTPPQGSVTLSSEAKNLIARTRRTYPNLGGNDHTPACKEGLAWREIIRQFPRENLRNTTRRASQRVSAPSHEEHTHLTTKDIPLSKMKKAELYEFARNLQEEVTRLRSDFSVFASNRSSELGELNLRLIAKERELEDLKISVNEEHEVGDMTLVDDPDDPPSALENAGEHVSKQLELQDYEADTRAHPALKRAPEGLERTISGSFIHSISKRPTPAPSVDSSDHGSPAPDFMDFDYDDADQTYVEPEPREPDGSGVAKGMLLEPGLQSHSHLVTPPASHRASSEQNEFENSLRRRILELLDERQEDKRSFEAKIASVETALEVRNAEVRSLKVQLHTRTEECETLQSGLASLQKSQESLGALLQQHASAKEQAKLLSEGNAKLQAAFDELQDQLNVKSTELKTCRAELAEKEATIVHAADKAAKLREELSETRKALVVVESRESVLVTQLDDARKELIIRDDTLQTTLRTLEDVKCQRDEIQERTSATSAELKESQMKECELKSNILRVSEELARLQDALGSFGKLDERQKGNYDSANPALHTSSDEFIEGMDTTESSSETPSNDEQSRGEARILLPQSSGDGLCSSLASAVAQVTELIFSLEKERSDQTSLRGVAEARTKELLAVQRSLEEVQQREIELQATLRGAHEKQMKAESETKSLREELEQTEGLLETIQLAYKRLRGQIDDVDKAIMSASQVNKKRKLATDTVAI